MLQPQGTQALLQGAHTVVMPLGCSTSCPSAEMPVLTVLVEFPRPRLTSVEVRSEGGTWGVWNAGKGEGGGGALPAPLAISRVLIQAGSQTPGPKGWAAGHQEEAK